MAPAAYGDNNPAPAPLQPVTAAASSALLRRHAGGFDLMYHMLQFYLAHLYAFLLHFDPTQRRRLV